MGVVSAALVAAVEELTARIKRLEKAARQPARKAYRPAEVAALLGVQPQTVRELIHSGRLEATDMGGWYLVSVAAVERLLAQGVRT